MELYFLRHGIAVEYREGKFNSDSERPLTKEGIVRMKESLHGMKRIGLSFDHVFSSPYVRAMQTAEIVAKSLSQKPPKATDALSPRGTFKDVIKLIQNFEGDAKVLFVGHQPCLGETISQFISGEPQSSVGLKKGALCLVETSEIGTDFLAELHWLLTSEQLCKLK